ncbi:MAG: DNA recombination protein RmuC [Chlorobaculum sp.]|jgi:DNA recombination protein RmuC|nr:DNA recombination protein RmuC [Chlorobaculum sp.]
MTSTLIILLLVILIAALGFLLLRSQRQASALSVENARLVAEVAHERERGASVSEARRADEARLQATLENLANRIVEERGAALSEQHRQRLDGLLEPFRSQLDSFRQRVDEVHRSDTELSARLLEQVRQLQELNHQVSDEANNLARAIKGESKKQGDWGELIVERLFEASGLVKGREYTVQESDRTDDGRLVRPDFMVHLPGEKAVVVDAKVSLTAYERWCSEEHEARRSEALREHVQSVRRHVAELERKDYAALRGNRTLDFVIMCIPLEPAYQAAMQADPTLFYDLAGRNVVVTGPATLMITLRLIAQIWRRENENRNAELIADKAGRIYDQVVLVAEAMSDARRKLSGVSESFDLAMKRLTEGRGNLAGRAEEIRRLGAKVSKKLPSEMAALEEGEEA